MKMENEQIKLLEHLQGVIKFESKRKKITAEDFNIFNILGISHLEVSTHSKFISNLLDPCGSHYQGSIFLELFLKKIDIEGFDYANAYIEVEKSENKYGRFDIFITDDKNWTIIIENKIHAGSQEEQLGRYIKYLKETGKTKNKKLLYLTLANEFDNDSHCNEDYSPGIGISQREKEFLKPQGVKTVDDIKLYKHITYSKDILDWLIDSQKEAVSLPRIREVIEQYIQIIRELTNKPEGMAMNEIRDYIKKDKEHYNALTECCKAYNNIRTDLIKKVFEDIKVIIKNKYPNAKIENSIEEDGTEKGLIFQSTKYENVSLRCVFEGNLKGKLFIGIWNEGKEQLQLPKPDGWKDGNGWIWKYCDFNYNGDFALLYFEDHEKLEQLIEEIAKVYKQLTGTLF